MNWMPIANIYEVNCIHTHRLSKRYRVLFIMSGAINLLPALYWICYQKPGKRVRAKTKWANLILFGRRSGDFTARWIFVWLGISQIHLLDLILLRCLHLYLHFYLHSLHYCSVMQNCNGREFCVFRQGRSLSVNMLRFQVKHFLFVNNSHDFSFTVTYTFLPFPPQLKVEEG